MSSNRELITDFNIFGSPSSQDRDVMVYLDKLPALEDCKKLSIEINPYLETMFSDNKQSNSNFGVLKDGVLVEVFKGTVDEVNNSIFLTYQDHEQLRELKIKRLIPRDKQQKLLRVARIVLSFYSKTKYREVVKKALRGNLIEKIEALKQINMVEIVDFDKKNQATDIYKNIAFQWGQILGLYQNKEFYTKESISQEYLKLRPALFRKNLRVMDLEALEFYKNEYISLAEKELPNLTKLVE